MVTKSKSKLPLIVLGACFVGIYLLLVAHPVAAVGFTWTNWVKWKIELTFPNNKAELLLTVQKGHTDGSGTHFIDDEVAVPLSCHVYGTPVIQNGGAIFDGGSYYECQMPSVKDIALQVWGLTIPASCSAGRPYVRGELKLEGAPLDPSPQNPVFFRDDIAFAVPLDVAAQEARLTVKFGQAVASSEPFPIDPNGHNIGAYLERTGPTQFQPNLVVDSIGLTPLPGVINQLLSFSTLESTVYFGYSPATGEYFEGIMGPMVVDPPCPAKW